ncbi:aspartate/glutamate racemase family protein [Variovorax sp. PBL-E5]|uniref:aspartate/glutamate racemase family protein n=1 Tax=Variovorax sp. PBL-E5 TaxID=434014 RepID=UPI00131632F6|nr:aspartate/glutamate racemase family protein [Variovorax sp. PBL-E5]VTU40030.1 hypothetical protein E5CHR_05311 [Variovorax sp. PBL-E5]
MRIACLHTADSNIAIFETAAAEFGLAQDALRHVVRPELLLDAEKAGGLTPAIAEATGALLLSLGEDADAVLLTCSTLGPSIDAAMARSRVPMLRADAALADAAVDAGGKVVVLCAAGTTVAPTTALFEQAAQRTGARVDVRLVAGAWALFGQGDAQRYATSIADAATAAYAAGADSVALAQASMAPAARLGAGRRPFTSPVAGLRAALAAMSGRANVLR